MGKELTQVKEKIIKALERLDKLWKLHGKDLSLFNGNSLRKGGTGQQYEIDTFPNIRGDGGDVFEYNKWENEKLNDIWAGSGCNFLKVKLSCCGVPDKMPQVRPLLLSQVRWKKN